MGLLRGGLIFAISFLLFLSLFFGNVFLTLNWSLDYNVLQPEIKNISQNIAEEWGITEEIEANKQYLELYCQTQDSIKLNESGFNLEIPCSTVNLGTKAMIEGGIDSLLNQIYYKNYNCSFWQCIKKTEDSTVLISETAKEYWKNNFKWALIISILLATALIFVESKKHTAFITIGILVMVAALPFKKIEWFFSIFPSSKVVDFIGLFFTKAENIFTTMMIIGVFLIIFGIALRIFKYGWKLSKWFTKKENNVSTNEIKEIVKEEVKDQKKEVLKKSKKK
jgi:hypothetical protein